MSSPDPTPPIDLPPADYPVDQRSCQLLGPTALVVQALMGVLVILSLVYKRHREKLKRPWKIWLFDVSKQIVGQMFVHGTNIFISDFGSHHSTKNACVFYFLNILIDTTLGVALIYLILRGLTHVFTHIFQLKGFESGQYGNPPSIKYWLRQAAVYVLSLTSMKLLVVGLFALYPGIVKIGEWLLSWTRTGDKDAFQVIFTMGIFPILMNIVQFWLIDSIVKASELPAFALQTDSTRHSYEDNQDREPLFGARSDEDDEVDTGNNPPHDIENPQSSSQSGDDTKVSTPNEPKATPSGATTPGTISDGGTSVAMHAYPPSIGSVGASPSSRRSSMSTSAGTSGNKTKRVPAPLHLQSALNFPERDIHPDPVPQSNRPISSHLIAKPEQDANMDWVSSWDDSDDWANKVGEDDWTEKREHKKGALSEAWGQSPLPQYQQHAGVVGS